jgi:hypothetical protein
VKAAAVDQTEGRFQTQVLLAKIGEFEGRCVWLSRRETATVLDGLGTVIKPKNGQTLASQPTANLSVPTAYVDDALIFRKPARFNRIDEFSWWLVGFPEGPKLWVSPLAFPYMAMSPVHPFGKDLFGPTLDPIYQFPRGIAATRLSSLGQKEALVRRSFVRDKHSSTGH